MKIEDMNELRLAIAQTPERLNTLQRLYTTEGIKVLENRLLNLIDLFLAKPNYPIKVRVLGFDVAEMYNEDELAGRIKELAEILFAGTIVEEKI